MADRDTDEPGPPAGEPDASPASSGTASPATGGAARAAASRLRWLRPGRLLRDLNILAILLLIAAAAALLLQPGSDDGLLGLPTLSVGQEAPRTVKSPRAFAIADLETTERLRQETVARVLPVYDLRTGLGAEAKARIETAFAEDATARGADAGPGAGAGGAGGERSPYRARAQAFLRALQVILDEDALIPLLRSADPDELRDAAIMLAVSLYERRIVEDRQLLRLQAPDGLQLRFVEPDETTDRQEIVRTYDDILSIDQARARVDDLVADNLKRLPADQRRAVSVLVKRLLTPNMAPNRAETERRIEAARAAVKPVVIPIKDGETVLRAGERVTERHLFILGGIEKELRSQSRVQAALGGALLIVLLVVVIYRCMIRGFPRFAPSYRDLAFLTSAFLIMLLVIWLGYKGAGWGSEAVPVIGGSAYRMMVPIAGFALLVSFVVGAEYGLAFAILSAVTGGWMMGSSLGYGAYVLVGALNAAALQDTDKPRTALLVSGLRAATGQMLVVVALALLESRLALEETAWEITAALVSGFASAVLAALLLPAVEVLFGYTTDLKLTDLANLNHPLLRDLLVEAPGTYHHSILVGRLAEAGARAIGANALLARVGAYYHDIGKIKNPRAFEENAQASFVSVAPLEEAREIRSHVAEGLALAARHRLGQPILEIIAQHHGTGVVRASYRRALDLVGQGPGAVDKVDFSYPGPTPLSREAALVMLADVVEFATRDLALEPRLDVPAIDAAVRRVIAEVLADGQLDASALTLQDIGRIARAFTSVLEDRLIRRGRPTLSQLPARRLAPPRVRPPMGGELN